jgi:AsmA family protein
MPIFWRTLAVLGGIVLLLLIAVAIAVRTVDVKEFLGPIQHRVKDATGRDLAVRGGIDLKLGLEPKLVLEDVTLANAPWSKDPQMIAAKRIEAQIALLPLLRRQFEVMSFKLVEPTIFLETDASGRGNWEFPSAASAANTTDRAPSGATLGGFSVGDIAIDDGAITFRDGKTGDVTKIVVETLSVHARDAQSPVSGKFRGTINDTAVALEGDFGPLDQLMRQKWPYPVTVQGTINNKKATVDTQVTVQNNTVGLDNLKVGSGTSQLTGKMAVVGGTSRPKVTFKFDAPVLSIADFVFPPAAVAAAKSAAKSEAKSKYVFSDAPIDVAALRDFDAEGELSVGVLTLPDGRRLDQVHVQIVLANGKLDVPALQATMFGGSLLAHAQIDAGHGQEAALNLHAEAKNLDLGALLTAAGVQRDVHGGKTELKVDVAARGASPHQWMSTANGNIVALVGPATVAGGKATQDSSLDRLAGSVNAFREIDAQTQLQCVVVRLPIKNGVANIDRSIATETSKIGATASGTLDFRNEMIDLSFHPQVREGIRIEVPQVAQLVRLRGSFASPSVGIDATATAATVARLGAAVYTGGLSILGESLLAEARADPGAPCQVALGRGGAAGQKPTNTNPAATATQDVGKALGRLLGR